MVTISLSLSVPYLFVGQFRVVIADLLQCVVILLIIGFFVSFCVSISYDIISNRQSHRIKF